MANLRSVKGPKFVQFFGPVLRALDVLGGSGRPAEVRNWISKDLNLDEGERSALLEGGAPRFDNQVAWARFYLSHGGYVDSSERGVWNLTDKGRRSIPMSQKQALEVFREVHSRFAKTRDSEEEPDINEDKTVAPPELGTLEEVSYREHLLQTLLELSPSGFERLCKRLLRESGFEEVEVTGKTGDGGIDGWGRLKINSFVSFKVLFQCKKYSTRPVNVAQVRDFRGAMQGRADKGIILTTGSFTADAYREALRDGALPIELVSGDKLLDMFEELELGLKPRKTFEVDTRFFDEFR
jgi:restriction system protein